MARGKYQQETDIHIARMMANFQYMLIKLGKTATTFAEEEDGQAPAHIRKNTILKFTNTAKMTTISAGSISRMVDLYNSKMHTSITDEDFENKDLAWEAEQEGRMSKAEENLIGDYIGLYLDANGYGDVLGMYIRIEKGADSLITAQAIHKIRDIDALMTLDADALFSDHIEEKLEEFMNHHQSMRKSSKYFCGNVTSIGSCAMINLATKKGIPQCQIILDTTGYLEEKNAGEHTRHDGYRGGLGLALATNSKGTHCMRFGLVRKDLASDLFFSTKSKIKELLKISAGSSHGEWYPLTLSKTLDSWWYCSFMKCHEKEKRLQSANETDRSAGHP